MRYECIERWIGLSCIYALFETQDFRRVSHQNVEWHFSTDVVYSVSVTYVFGDHYLTIGLHYYRAFLIAHYLDERLLTGLEDYVGRYLNVVWLGARNWSCWYLWSDRSQQTARGSDIAHNGLYRAVGENQMLVFGVDMLDVDRNRQFLTNQ